jgi:hypothetical protein
MDEDRDFTQDDTYALSVWAVNELIADVEVGRLLQDKELAEAIAICIRHSGLSQLKILKRVLDQHDVQGVPAWLEAETPRWWMRVS